MLILYRYKPFQPSIPKFLQKIFIGLTVWIVLHSMHFLPLFTRYVDSTIVQHVNQVECSIQKRKDIPFNSNNGEVNLYRLEMANASEGDFVANIFHIYALHYTLLSHFLQENCLELHELAQNDNPYVFSLSQECLCKLFQLH